MTQSLEELIEKLGKVSCCGCCYDEHDISEELKKAYELGQENNLESN